MSAWWKRDNELQGLNLEPTIASADPKPASSSEKKPTREELGNAIRSAPGFDERVKAVRERALAMSEKMLEPGNSPEFIFALAESGSASNRGNFLVMQLTSGPMLLLFTTPYRALDYAEHTNPGKFHLIRFDVSSLAKTASDFSSGGTKSYAVDRCPRCSELQAYPLGTLSNPRAFFFAWALAVTLQRLQAEQIVRAVIGNADAKKRVSLLRQLIEHVDPSNPTAYHFLAFTAQEADKALTEWALNRIKTFWPNYVADIEPPPSSRDQAQLEKWTARLSKLTMGIGIEYGVLKIPTATAGG